MSFLKKFIFGFTAIFFILMGGAGTQSTNTLLQGSGFIGLIIGLGVLYIFVKMAWRAVGCLPSLIVLLSLVFFILYAIGAFSNGFTNIGANLQNFLGRGVKTSEEVVSTTNAQKYKHKEGVVDLLPQDQPLALSENISDSVIPNRQVKKPNSFNPMDYPSIIGPSRVICGDSLILNNRVVKLYAVAAPEISQTCADASGRGYKCGHQAYSWLSGWLAENSIKCHILHEDQTGTLTGVCLLGPYDLGAALVNAGWAVADTRQSGIYVPYQNQAINNRRGLWQGEFYMPWDWKKIQARKANVKVIKPKNSDSSRRHVWYNPFGE